MRDTIYREEAIKKIAEHLGMPAENWMKIAEEWLREVPSAAQPLDVQIAYYKGLNDGIEKCTEEIKRLTGELGIGQRGGQDEKIC